MPKLTVVVGCSDRKTAPVTPELRVRNLPEGGLARRLDTWNRRLEDASSITALDALYCGEHWVQTKALMGVASAAGFDASLWVASAGLGLQPVDYLAPAYGATFATRHLDSVATTGYTAQQWWTGLQLSRGSMSLPDLAGQGSLLLSLSADYTRALGQELAAVAEMETDAVLIGGAPGVHSPPRVPSDRRLRRELNGTLSSLNTRMAAAWLTRLAGERLFSSGAKNAWDQWIAEVAVEESYQRVRITDEWIRQYIRSELATDPGLSRSRMHRRLRDSDGACEQARFARLYAQVKETA